MNERAKALLEALELAEENKEIMLAAKMPQRFSPPYQNLVRASIVTIHDSIIERLSEKLIAEFKKEEEVTWV